MLSDDDVRKSITDELDKRSWELKDGKLVKSFQFPSFIKAIDYVNEIAIIAERLDHHPIITINWKTVKLSLKSFDVDAITKRDITLAKEIDRVEEQLKKIENNKN
jgi:4a-hydroxytetrahydrobiopterin dehydratase